MSDHSPFSAALGTPQGSRALLFLSVNAAFRALGLMLIAEAVARSITDLIAGHFPWQATLLGLGGVVLRGVTTWANRGIGAHASHGVKSALRARVLGRALAGSGRDLKLSDGALTIAVTRSLDDLDDYFTAVLPSLVGTLVIPLALLVRIAFTDWVSVAVLVITLPLVPLFMVLIGRYTSERVSEATRALDQLSANLVELARGLPVLVGLGRVQAQTRALRKMSESYRTTTMTTLRVAFLSALALELISTLSVALVAVCIGVRLVNGTMGLEAGLLALVLAPELFLPLRQLGAAFHSSENGMAAYRRVRSLIDTPRGAGFGCASAAVLRVDGLTVSYADRSTPALRPVTAEFPVGLTSVTGPSGSGKSTLLKVLTGELEPGDGVSVNGSMSGRPRSIAYAPQTPRFFCETIAEELRLYAGPLRDAALADCLATVGLVLDPHTSCAALSPGEQRRLAIARALARVEAGAQLLVVDEPTAHLDSDLADLIRRSLADAARTVPVIAATHDSGLIARGREVQVAAHSRSALGAHEAGTAEVHPSPRLLSHSAETGPELSFRRAAGRLLRVIDVRSPAFALSVLCGVCAVAAGSALTGISGWLIVHASFQPPIMYLLVAIVGVRFFGLSRSVFTYARQLNIHNAVLKSLTELRVRIWTRFARQGTANRAIAGGDVALNRLISVIDDIRDTAPRAVLAPIVAAVVTMAAAAVLWIISPAAGVVGLAGCLTSLIAAPALALWADRDASRRRTANGERLLGAVSRLLAARHDLALNGVGESAAAQVAAVEHEGEDLERRALRAQGVGEAAAVAVMTAAAMAMIPVLAPAVLAETVSPELLAVAVLLPLSLIDACVDSAAAVQRWPALRSMLSRLVADGLLDSAAQPESAAQDRFGRIYSVELDGITAGWPGLQRPVLDGLSLHGRTGEWTSVTGPSGSGKTTCVSVLLRFLDPLSGKYRLNGEDALTLVPAQLSGAIAWCPQESHVFDSSLRSNLRIARSVEDAPDDSELLEVLGRVGLGQLAADMGLDAPIGAQGEFLSGGQRQRLAIARTLLAGASVIILDEPTAHLDEDTAAKLMSDLRETLGGCTVVCVTHDEAQSARQSRRVPNMISSQLGTEERPFFFVSAAGSSALGVSSLSRSAAPVCPDCAASCRLAVVSDSQESPEPCVGAGAVRSWISGSSSSEG